MKLCFCISQNASRRVGRIRVSDDMLPLTVKPSQKYEGESGDGDSNLSALEISLTAVGLLATENFSSR